MYFVHLAPHKEYSRAKDWAVMELLHPQMIHHSINPCDYLDATIYYVE